MATELEQHFFGKIKEIWGPFESVARGREKNIIPFCTPVVMNPPALVIGRNHTHFAPMNEYDDERIARKYARSVRDVNTYIVHDHHFAVGLRQICEGALVDLTEDWVGTNRCSVQWDATDDAIDEIRRTDAPAFDDCQGRMDEVLKELVLTIRPRNVILVGEYARGLFYERKATGQTFDDFEPMNFPQAKPVTWIIAVPNPGRLNNRERATARLRRYFKRR